MSTQIARQISVRMKAKNLSVRALEKEAGLKTHAVQNILRGKSKRPSADILQSVSDILGCTVKDLLATQEIFQEDESSRTKNEILQDPYEHPALLLETVKTVNDKLQQKGSALTVEHVLACIEEVYIHSLQRNSEKVDQEFVDWFIDLLTS